MINWTLNKFNNERDLEVPVVLNWVKKLGREHSSIDLLDVGAHYSHATYAHEVRSLIPSPNTYDGVDILPDPETAKVLDNYLVQDVKTLDGPYAYRYTHTMCISVLEHSGINPYQSTNIEAEQLAVFEKILNLGPRGSLFTFPFGSPGVYPKEYSNIHLDLLMRMDEISNKVFGLNSYFDTKFYFSDFPPRGTPWKELSLEEASKVPLRVDVGVVQCVCVLEMGVKE